MPMSRESVEEFIRQYSQIPTPIKKHPPWRYESDGGLIGPKTHYLTNGESRMDFDSRASASHVLRLMKEQSITNTGGMQ